MQTLRKILALLSSLLAIAMIATPQTASAQATRTWVSGVGDDANPCSRTAPCKTFAGAISKTAANGEINCIDPGGFGAVTITKSIIIDCKGVMAGVLNSSSNGIIINAGTGQVTVRNLSVDGAGTGLVGIRVMAASSVQIDNVVVRGQAGSGIDVTASANTRLAISNSLIRENTQHGILVAPTGGAAAAVSVSRTTIAANGITGIRVGDNVSAVVSDSVLTGNGTHGVAAASSGSPARISLERVVTSGNVNGGVLANGAAAVVWLSEVFSTGNAYGLFPPSGGGSYISFGNNRIVGNTTADGSPSSTLPQQ